VACTASGAIAAICSASEVARASSVPRGTTSCTSPIRRASSAPNSSQVSRWYIALPQPPRSTKRIVAPPVAWMPRFGSSCEKRQSSAATTMSPASIISIPAV
jgi:hypothetical protein